MGGKLVDIGNHNLAALTVFINGCFGSYYSRIRIQIWDTNTFATINLAIFTGSISGFGTVNITINDKALYALCAMTHSNVINADTSSTINNVVLA